MSIQYYADSDSAGKIVGFYNDDIHAADKIPVTAIKISEEQWLDCVNNQNKWTVKAGALVLAPAPTESEQLASAQASKIADLNAKCNATILGGFTSSALGAAHTYDFDEEAQRNLSGRLTLFTANASYPASFKWKTKDAGPLDHTKAQFTQVCTDADTFKDGVIAKYWSLKAQVNAATTVDAVNAIVW